MKAFAIACLIVLAGLLAGHAPVAHATISIVQTCKGNTGNTSGNATCVFAGNVASGNVEVFGVGFDNCSDSGTTSKKFGTTAVTNDPNATNNNGAGVSIAGYYITGQTTGTTFTIVKGTTCAIGIIGYELTGWDGTTVLDGNSVTAVDNVGLTTLTHAMSPTSVAIDVQLGFIFASGLNVTYTTANSPFSNDQSLTTNNVMESEKFTTAASGTNTCGWSTISNAFTRTLALACMTIKGVSTTPTISGPSASEQQGVAFNLTGVNFEASQGAGHVDCGTAGHTTSQTVNSWNATTINITPDKGNTQFGTTWPCTVTTNSAVASNTWTGITGLTPPSGYGYVNISTPNATASLRLTTATTDLASGDQCVWQNSTATVNADGTWKNTQAGMPFLAYCWHAAAFNWGAAGSQSFTAPVAVAGPAAFGFFQ